MKYYLGIDGGGTKTKAVITDESGNVIKRITGKTINFYSVGTDCARGNLRSLINEIQKETEIKFFDGVFIGCSALDSEADNKTVENLCGGIINSNKIKINSDTYIALKSMENEKESLVVICGTGSMAIAETDIGETLISGGWGHILGDEGSAYSIAVSALKTCAILSDRGENSSILQGACMHFGVHNFREIINIIYSHHTTKDMVASFAKVVSELCENGDEDAKNIIKTEAIKLSKTAEILLKKMKKCSNIGLYGGVFENNRLFKNIFIEEIKRKYPYIQIELLPVSPEESAANLARKL